MKTESEIREAIRAFDLYLNRNLGDPANIRKVMAYCRDSLAWVVGHPPLLHKYPPIDATVENQRNIDTVERN